jgi:hypothetical protein
MTSRTRPFLSLEETLAAAVQQGEIDAVIEKTVAMSDLEIAVELEADGVDLNALDLRMQAMRKKLFGEAPPAGKAASSGARRFVQGAAAGAVVTGTLVAALARGGAFAPAPRDTSPPAELRRAAFEACGRGNWEECLEKLDEAKKLDPKGDDDFDVREARSLAYARGFPTGAAPPR